MEMPQLIRRGQIANKDDGIKGGLPFIYIPVMSCPEANYLFYAMLTLETQGEDEQ
jgi:hypothetical protein